MSCLGFALLHEPEEVKVLRVARAPSAAQELEVSPMLDRTPKGTVPDEHAPKEPVARKARRKDYNPDSDDLDKEDA